jgi:hypothetical protein
VTTKALVLGYASTGLRHHRQQGWAHCKRLMVRLSPHAPEEASREQLSNLRSGVNTPRRGSSATSVLLLMTIPDMSGHYICNIGLTVSSATCHWFVVSMHALWNHWLCRTAPVGHVGQRKPPSTGSSGPQLDNGCFTNVIGLQLVQLNMQSRVPEQVVKKIC